MWSWMPHDSKHASLPEREKHRAGLACSDQKQVQARACCPRSAPNGPKHPVPVPLLAVFAPPTHTRTHAHSTRLACT